MKLYLTVIAITLAFTALLATALVNGAHDYERHVRRIRWLGEHCTVTDYVGRGGSSVPTPVYSCDDGRKHVEQDAPEITP